jgi:hypothetical protein
MRELMRDAYLVLAIPLWAACGGEPPAEEEPAPDSAAAAVESPEVAALRNKLQPLQDFAQAAPAGYTQAITPCWYHRVEGGQGIHFGNTALIDGALTAMDPELVMYEPQQGGGQQLVGVEYIVPFDQWSQPNPPTVLGQMLHRNEALSLWVLHVWLWRENPSGLYADWNPNVSCTNATASEDRAPPG